MHALSRLSRVTGEKIYNQWAIELAQTAHVRFTYISPPDGRKRMYWKMSIDLSRPLVTAMGQHDSGQRSAASWQDHREINMVMLATSLLPDGFLSL